MAYPVPTTVPGPPTKYFTGVTASPCIRGFALPSLTRKIVIVGENFFGIAMTTMRGS